MSHRFVHFYALFTAPFAGTRHATRHWPAFGHPNRAHELSAVIKRESIRLLVQVREPLESFFACPFADTDKKKKTYSKGDAFT